MPKFFSPADKAADWQQLLAKPDLHWKTGYSAISNSIRAGSQVTLSTWRAEY